MTKTADLKNKLRESKPAVPAIDYKAGLSFGCVPLNLACTGRAGVGLLPSTYMLFVGDTDSGKSFLAMNVFAEAANNERYDDYDLIYDGPENGAKMDVEKFYGKKTKARLVPPSPRGQSQTLEEFYFNLDDRFASKKPFIWVLDSVDSLKEKGELKKFKQHKKSFFAGKEDDKGSYGMGAAKLHSENLRTVPAKLAETGSILIIINQTRDNTDMLTAKFKPKKRSGGWALEFYADVQMWSSVREKIKVPVLGKKRTVGTLCKMHVKRSRFTGAERTVFVPILRETGIDDTGAMIAWLVDERHWKGPRRDDDDGDKKVIAPEFEFEGSAELLARKIESEDRETELRMLVADHWRKIDEELAQKVIRKKRYT